MATKKPGPRNPVADSSRSAHDLFKQIVEPNLTPQDKGKYVAIDIKSGEFEIHRNATTASRKLWSRLDDPQPFLLRIGYPTAVKFGPRKDRTR